MFDDREPDGEVRYHRDSIGARVGVLPATCKVGIHSVSKTGYRAIERNGVLYLSCTACSEDLDPDHFWALRTDGPSPSRIELDDAPYLAMTRNMVVPDRRRL
ncbi:hypothetical protein [Actinokineospora sp. UTMC 2448]|uniref:hypothetical protein n=1 Tax=Actinokineospora sp. UTMC 2448 TaxID=2268449 RepID=UPI0021647771|nr:hypothetical protein [Actinokineospora sp. UTMC 2448]UVS80613.1 hypothetical protein Actkin_04364 [Actinokineospora sp. UTMC 2448]